MYPYIKLSYEGEILLEEYKNILNWIDNIILLNLFQYIKKKFKSFSNSNDLL